MVDGYFINSAYYMVYNKGDLTSMKKGMKIFYWLLGLFVLYLIIELLRKIFGGSLGFEELVIGLLIANLGYVITLHGKIGELKAEVSRHLGWHAGKGNHR